MKIFATLIFAGSVFAAALTAAQQSAPRPAGRGLTTSSTWTDDDLDKTMKQIGSGAMTLRKLIDAQEAPAAEAQADTLEHLFDDVEEFFVARKNKEAEQFAKTATDHSNHVEDALKGKDFAKAGEHLKLLMATCQSCHTKFRERLPDGTYQMRKP